MTLTTEMNWMPDAGYRLPLFVLLFSLRPKGLGSRKVAMNGVLTTCMARTLLKCVKLAGLCFFVACRSNGISIILSSRQFVRFKGISYHSLESHHCYYSTQFCIQHKLSHISPHTCVCMKNTTCSMHSNTQNHTLHLTTIEDFFHY